MKKFFYILIFFTTILVCLYLYGKSILFSPYSSLNNDFPDYGLEVVGGFVPHWTLNKLKNTEIFNNLYYFSFKIKADGTIEKNSKNDLGYYRFFNNKNIVSLFNKKTKFKRNLTITQLNKNDIESFLNNKGAQINLIREIKPFFIDKTFQNLNVDIEYSGTQSAQLKDNFTNFIDLINQEFSDIADFELSVCVYGRSAQYQQIWDIKNLANKIDYFIIMAYDYFNATSPKPGPVAPLNDEFNHNVIIHLKSFLNLVDSKKIVLGIPLYGYGWQVDSLNLEEARVVEKNSFSLPLTSIENLKNNKEINDLNYHWDDVSFSPYLTYLKDKNKYIVYYEDKKSLQEKADLAKKLNLKGVAFWVLGYELDNYNWDVIFNTKSN
jgi:spore germination protein